MNHILDPFADISDTALEAVLNFNTHIDELTKDIFQSAHFDTKILDAFKSVRTNTAFNDLKETLESVDKLSESYRKTFDALNQTTSAWGNIAALVEEINRPIDELLQNGWYGIKTPNKIATPAKERPAIIVPAKPKIIQQPFVASLDGVTRLYYDTEVIIVSGEKNQSAKALTYAFEHLGEQITYTCFYDIIRNPERGLYTSLPRKLTDEEKITRAKATLNHLYKLDVGKILTIHFRKQHFSVTLKK